MRRGRWPDERHRRHIEGRSARTRIGVAAHDGARRRRADDIEFDLIVGLGELRADQLVRRLLRFQLCPDLPGGVLRLFVVLLRGRVLRDKALEAVFLANGCVILHLQNRQLRFGLGQLRGDAVAAEAGVVVYLMRKDLVLFDLVAFLDVDFPNDAGSASGDIDKTAFDVDLARRNRGIGCCDRVGIDRRTFSVGGCGAAIRGRRRTAARSGRSEQRRGEEDFGEAGHDGLPF